MFRTGNSRTSKWLHRHALAFLHESNALDDILNIRENEGSSLTRGHVGGLIASHAKAEAGQPITVQDLCEWQRLIPKNRCALDIPWIVGALAHCAGRARPSTSAWARTSAPIKRRSPQE